MMNKYPYNNGHMMIVPYSHKSEISDLTRDEQCEMMQLAGKSVKILKKVLKCAGANCGMNIGKAAGAGIAGHVHMHVIPRWQGDLNFLPVIADVKSMPEYIEETYKKLKPHF
jgi:ATP adenylyltransferase